MRNQYNGICYRCGGLVKAGEGHFEKTLKSHFRKFKGIDIPNWLTQHAKCAIKYRGTDQHYLRKEEKMTTEITIEADSTELAVLDNKEQAVALFQKPDGLDSLVENITKRARSYVGSLATDKARKEWNSQGAQVNRDRLKIEKTLKTFTDDLQSQVDAVKGRGKKASDALKLIADEVQKPVKEWEEKEKARKTVLQGAIAQIKGFTHIPFGFTVEQIQQRLDMLDMPDPTVWAEFQKEADEAKAATKIELTQKRDYQIHVEKIEADNKILAEKLAEAEASRPAVVYTGPDPVMSAPETFPDTVVSSTVFSATAAPLQGAGFKIPDAPASDSVVFADKRDKALAAVQEWFKKECPIPEMDVRFIFTSIELGEIPHFTFNIDKA